MTSEGHSWVLQMTQTLITNVQSEQLLNMSTYASSVLHELSISVLRQRDIDTDDWLFLYALSTIFIYLYEY